MDFISNKAISIGVGVLITIIVTSAVIFTVTQVVSIYSKVYNTDTSIKGKYDEFDKFKEGNREFTELEVYNFIKKYYGNNFNDGDSPKDNRVKEIKIFSGSVHTPKALVTRITGSDKEKHMSKKWKSKLNEESNGQVTIEFIILTSE